LAVSGTMISARFIGVIPKKYDHGVDQRASRTPVQAQQGKGRGCDERRIVFVTTISLPMTSEEGVMNKPRGG